MTQPNPPGALTDWLRQHGIQLEPWQAEAVEKLMTMTREEITDALNTRHRTPSVTWNQWAPDALHSPLAPAYLVEAYNRWQPDHLKIRREQL